MILTGKKAMSESALAAIIIAIIGGIVVTLVLRQFLISGGAVGQIAGCRENVKLADGSALLAGAQVIPITKCYTQDAGVLKASSMSGRELTKELAPEVAKMVYNCWHMWGDGQYDPWKKGTVGRKSICGICYLFELESGKILKASPVEGVYSLLDWMRATPSPSKTEKQTYYDAVKDGIPYGENLVLDKREFGGLGVFWSTMTDYTMEDIYGGEQYAVVYNYLPESYASKWIGRPVGYVGTFISPVLALKTFTTGWPVGTLQNVYIMPVKNLGSGCEVTYSKLAQ